MSGFCIKGDSSFQRSGRHEISHSQDTVCAQWKTAGKRTGKGTSGFEGAASGFSSYDNSPGNRSEIIEKIQAKNPLFMEVLPLTLEEIFISETEVAGYEIKNLF